MEFRYQKLLPKKYVSSQNTHFFSDFKKEIKPVGEQLEVNEIITTRNGLKIQKMNKT